MPPLLDVAIGTVFVFLLFSLVVSALNEYILSLTDQRAKFLRLGLAELFGHQQAVQSRKTRFVNWLLWPLKSVLTLGGLFSWYQQTNLGPDGEQLLQHGLLNAFSRSDNGGTSPSYIPAGAFVTGLLDLVVTKPGSTPGQWSVGHAPVIIDFMQKIQAASAAAPITPARYNTELNGFITAYQGLAPAPAVDSVIDSLFVRVAQALAKPELPSDKATAKTALAGAANFNAANLAIAAQKPNLQPLLNAIAAQASGDFDKLKKLLEDFNTTVTSVDLDAELTTVGSAAIDALTLTVRSTIDYSAQTIESSLNALPASKMKESLLSLYRVAGGDVQKFKTSIEGWFNGVMDRVSGWYKRFAQKWMIVLGLILAAAFNVDTIEIVRVLSKNPNLAQAVASQAEAYASKNGRPKTAEELAKRREDLRQAVKVAEDKLDALKDASEQEKKTAQEAVDQAHANADALKAYQNAVATLEGTGIPIGWTKEKFSAAGGRMPQFTDDLTKNVRACICWPFATLWLLRLSIPGWFLTAIAASLGAPFWFDLLGRFVNIRAAGKPPGQTDATSTPTRPPPASLDTTPGR